MNADLPQPPLGSRRAQFSIEFFLIASFLILLTSAILASALYNLDQNDVLRDAVFARAAVDGVADAITFVSWQSSGARVVNEYFLPSNACLIVNATDNTLECDVGLTRRVKSHAFTLNSSATITPSSGCRASGWKTIVVKNDNGAPTISCTALN